MEKVDEAIEQVSEPRLEALAARIKEGGGDVTYATTDVRRPEDLRALTSPACDTHGQLDVLISDAGVMPISPRAGVAGAAAGTAAGRLGGGRPDRGHRRRRARDHPAPGLVLPGPPGAALGADRRHDRHRPDAFTFRPPPGARIFHGGLLAETGLSPGEIAWHAATAAPKLAIEIARRWIGSR